MLYCNFCYIHHHRSSSNKISGGFFFLGTAKWLLHLVLSSAHLRIAWRVWIPDLHVVIPFRVRCSFPCEQVRLYWDTPEPPSTEFGSLALAPLAWRVNSRSPFRPTRGLYWWWLPSCSTGRIGLDLHERGRWTCRCYIIRSYFYLKCPIVLNLFTVTIR